MSGTRNDLERGRWLGPVLVGLVLVVMVVIARGTASDPGATTTTQDFTNRTTVPPDTTTTLTTTQAPNAASSYYDEVGRAAGWFERNPGDLGFRREFIATRAGDRLVVWGGIRPAGLGERRGGASFGGSQWTPIATSPIVAGDDPVSVWTGTELFIYSGAAAAWEPDSNTWRELAYPPTGSVSGAFPLAGVWTGEQVILVGYRVHPPTREEDNLFVASYGSDLGCCESYSDPPFSLTYGEAFWTGDEMLLIGALLDPDWQPATDDGLGRMAGFDPVTKRWTEYEAPPLEGPGRISAAWTGTRLMAWRADGDAAEWTKDGGWRLLPGPPIPGTSCQSRSEAVGEDVFILLCNSAAVWSDAAQRWFRIFVPTVAPGFSNACVPVVSDIPRHRLELWCSTETGNAFWSIDLSAVEAIRYSESATLSQWELFPNPAATRLDSTSMVWSGEELLYFSGHGIEVEEYRGWGYSPERNSMHGIPDAPWPGRSGQVALWTGDEMLISRGPTTIWNPFTLEWRTAHEYGIGSVGFASPFAVWTGTEAIFYGSRHEPSNAGAAYDPETDTWRDIETGPTAVAVGVQVMASSGDKVYALGNWSGFDDSQSGAVYDPETDKWSLLPPIPEEFALSGSVGDFVDGEFIVIGENWDPLLTEDAPLIAGLAYSPESNSWRTIAALRTVGTLPHEIGRFGSPFRSMAATGHRDELAVFLPAGYSNKVASIAFYRPSTDSWRYVDDPPADAMEPPMVSGDTFVAYLTPEGTVLLHDG